jgi:hypothetical protein
MRQFKLKDEVISCGSRKGVLSDHNAVYPESVFNPGHADELVKGGFLVEVKEPEYKHQSESLTAPESDVIEPYVFDGNVSVADDAELEIDISEITEAKTGKKSKKGK